MAKRDLLKNVNTAVQAAVKTLRLTGKDDFAGGNGNNRICIVPLTRDFDEYWGDVGNGCEYEYNFPLTPGGSRTIKENGVDVNCYAFSALKIATCAKLAIAGKRRSVASSECQALPDLDKGVMTPDNGYACYPGAVCGTISNVVTGEISARVYVCVSGGRSENDEIAALIGLRAFMDNVYALTDGRYEEREDKE